MSLTNGHGRRAIEVAENGQQMGEIVAAADVVVIPQRDGPVSSAQFR
jgi:hypothetical protein